MKEELRKLIMTTIDPDIQVLVAEIIGKEREYLDYLRPRVKEEIRIIIERHLLEQESEETIKK